MRVDLEEAVALLNQGKLVAIPTETVYGLAARIDRPQAIQAIFERKGRPRNNPLIVHVASKEELGFVDFEEVSEAQALIEAFWPGPLGLILPQKRVLEKGILDPQITAGLSTIAVRSPSHPLALQLLQATGPLVAPSANPSGRPSPTCAGHVLQDYAGELAVLEGGSCARGVESTLLHWHRQRWWIARPGALDAEVLAALLGYPPQPLEASHQPLCPGQLLAHYAPKAKLLPMRLLEDSPSEGACALLGFKGRRYPPHLPLYLLGTLEDPAGCLQLLYHCLRALDLEKVERAAVDDDLPPGPRWATLKDRLEKAMQGAP